MNSITFLEASAVGSALAVVKVTFAEPATSLAKYPAPKASIVCKLVFVLFPQTLALAPVSINSNLSLSEYVDAIYAATCVHVLFAPVTTFAQGVDLILPKITDISTPVGVTTALPEMVSVPSEN